MRINKFWGALVLGLILGASGGIYWTRRTLMRLIPREPNIARIADRLTSELKLDSKQQEGLKKILEDYRNKVNAANKSASTDRGALRESMRSEIKKLLNPDQIKKYEERVARAEARRKASEESIKR